MEWQRNYRYFTENNYSEVYKVIFPSKHHLTDVRMGRFSLSYSFNSQTKQDIWITSCWRNSHENLSYWRKNCYARHSGSSNILFICKFIFHNNSSNVTKGPACAGGLAGWTTCNNYWQILSGEEWIVQKLINLQFMVLGRLHQSPSY